jgi:hypothetical protein
MKKTIFKACCLCLFTFFFAFACNKKEPITPIDTELEFKLRLLNDKKQEATVFKQGENYWLSFIIINKSSHVWYLYPEQLSNSNDFLRVYDNGNRDMGRPYKSVFACLLIPNFAVPRNDTMKMEMPWQYIADYNSRYFCGADTTTKPLSVGTYRTGFKAEFKLAITNKEVYSKELSFDKQFQIQ